MYSLLEISGEEIAQLDDRTLRELIGLLCEADYRLAGLSTRGIMCGGNQDARDGGLDVVIRSEVPPPKNSFVPRRITGFQVKKTDMSPSKIHNEMRPSGILREEINNIINEKGAYVIVSSAGSNTYKAIKSRINAMKEAVAYEDTYNNLYLDFLDRDRLANWLRTHPSLILWVRNKIGCPLRGWRSYENWANSPGGIEEEYLLDEGLRFHDGTKNKFNRGDILNGLQKLRSVLSVPGNSARLAGLSGVGKTRFVQAIFDERIGEQALNKTQVIYTDMSSSPVPEPLNIAEQLIFDKTRAILIIDNCPPHLHSQLTELCKKDGNISLLTIEYDVREHLPEETSVFRLEPASEEVIEKVILKRYQHIGKVDARTIADFSGGNFRLAIALANTMQQGETLSGFQDNELFERLFWQRYEETESLLISAEVCSLVYSFEGTDASSEESELKILASIIDKTGNQLYRDIARLIERDLIQLRNVWRAVLPQAIANRLARRALESIPNGKIVEAFFDSGLERLIKSFTRRLSYLHDCDQAIEIAGEWLSSDGWIGKKKCNLSNYELDIMKNIAPLLPQKALEVLEYAANGDQGKVFTSRENNHFYDYVQLLRNLAYDPELFNRSVTLMCRFAISEKPEENYNSTRDVLKSLFYIYLSGTHAYIEDRARIIEELVSSKNYNKKELGIFLLSAALETGNFISTYGFSFGARPRDFGYQPQTYEEIKKWYETFTGICTRLALSDKKIAPLARKLLADKLRGLWTNAGMIEVLENSAKQIHKRQAWNEGWIATRKIIKYDSKDFKKEIQKRLYKLEEYLKPNNLLEKARTYALSEQHHTFDLEDLEEYENANSGLKRIDNITKEIGNQVAQDKDTLNNLLQELFTNYNIRLGSFGRGLAEGCDNKQEMWQLLYSQFRQITGEKRQIRVLLGFLSSCAESDPDFYNSILDDIVNDDLLSGWLPIFQTTSTIDKRGIKRLHEAIEKGKADIYTFRNLAWGRAHESISDDDLADLLRKILSKDNGVNVVIEILAMRFHELNEEQLVCSNDLKEISREAISNYSFFYKRNRSESQDYDLAKIARICLKDHEGVNTAKEVCQNLVKAITESNINAFNYTELLNSIALIQPIEFLNIFLGYEGIKDYQLRWMFLDDIGGHKNPLDQISDDNLLLWCDNDPEDRYPLLILAIEPFTESGEENKLEWKSIVYSILEKAPDLEIVFQNLANAIRPTIWGGSLADIMQKRADLFYTLYQHENEEVRALAIKQYSIIREIINKERRSEKHLNNIQNERFE